MSPLKCEINAAANNAFPWPFVWLTKSATSDCLIKCLSVSVIGNSNTFSSTWRATVNKFLSSFSAWDWKAAALSSPKATIAAPVNVAKSRISCGLNCVA